MKWVNYSERRPPNEKRWYVFRQAGNTRSADSHWPQIMGNVSDYLKLPEHKIEWLDEETPSFSQSDLILVWAKAQESTIENTYYDRLDECKDIDYSCIEKERNEFFEKQFNFNPVK